MAMQKELVNTPERLAKVKPPASRGWAAIHKGKQKSRSAKQAEKQTMPTISRPREDVSEAAAAVSQAAPADSIPEEGAELAVTSPSDNENKASDAILMSGLVEEATVHFSLPEAVEDSSEVSPQSCWTMTWNHRSDLLLHSGQAPCTSQVQVEHVDMADQLSTTAASSKLGCNAADTFACWSAA